MFHLQRSGPGGLTGLPAHLQFPNGDQNRQQLEEARQKCREENEEIDLWDVLAKYERPRRVGPLRPVAVRCQQDEIKPLRIEFVDPVWDSHDETILDLPYNRHELCVVDDYKRVEASCRV